MTDSDISPELLHAKMLAHLMHSQPAMPVPSRRVHRAHISTSSSLSSTFSDVSSLASVPSPHPSPVTTPTTAHPNKTNAFFGSPFSTRPPSPNLPATPTPVRISTSGSTDSHSSGSSLTTDFFAPSVLTTPPNPVTEPPQTNSNSKKILARLFPSRYNTNPAIRLASSISPQRDFLELDIDHVHSSDLTINFFDPSSFSVGDSESTPRPVDAAPPSYITLTRPPPSPVPSLVLRPGMKISSSPTDGKHEHTRLTLIHTLGQGTFSSVWLAEDRSSHPLLSRSTINSNVGKKSIPGTKPMSPEKESSAAGMVGSSYLNESDGEGNVLQRLGTQVDGAYVSEDARGTLVAVKMTPRAGADDNDRTSVSFIREVEVLRHISHPHITSLLTSLSTPTHHILVLPYLPGGDLLSLVNSDYAHGRVGESVLREMWRELVSAVGWMHSVGLVHRDLKLENILLATTAFFSSTSTAPPTLLDLPTPLIKLTDFGLSRFIDVSHPLLTTRCGSEAYAAPELVIGGTNSSGNENGYGGWRGYDGRETDAWACGVVMYALVCRALPFGEGPGGSANGAGMRGEMKAGQRRRTIVEREDRRHWLMRIAKGEWAWPRGSTDAAERAMLLYGPRLVESVGARRVVWKLLVRDPQKRAKVADLLADEWMREGRAEYQHHRRNGSRSSRMSREGLAVEDVADEVDRDGDGDGEDGEEEGELVDKEGIDHVACQEVL